MGIHTKPLSLQTANGQTRIPLPAPINKVGLGKAPHPLAVIRDPAATQRTSAKRLLPSRTGPPRRIAHPISQGAVCASPALPPRTKL